MAHNLLAKARRKDEGRRKDGVAGTDDALLLGQGG